jgi:hypothetical protein
MRDRADMAAKLVATYGPLPELYRVQEVACELAADIARCRRRGGCPNKHLAESMARMNIAMAVLETMVDPALVCKHERQRCEELLDDIEITELTRTTNREGAE